MRPYIFSDTFQTILVGVIAVVFVLGAIGKRYPHIAWLQNFRLHDHRTAAQKARVQRRANALAAYEMMLLGLVLPIGYVLVTLFMFNEPDPLILAATCAGGLFFIGLGIWFRVRNR